MGGCGDVVRNITGCPVAGVDHDELFDVTAAYRRDRGIFLRQSRVLRPAAQAQDLRSRRARISATRPRLTASLWSAMLKDGREGFAVRVGGGQSSTPRLSRHLGVFITREQAMPVMRAIIDVWQGTTEYRMSRVKARLKFMIDDYGVEEFRKLVEAKLGFALESLAEMPIPETESDHIGIHEQKQPGLNYVGFPVYLGADERAPDARNRHADGLIRRRHPPDAAAKLHHHRNSDSAARRRDRGSRRRSVSRSRRTGCTRRRSDVSAIRIATTPSRRPRPSSRRLSSGW